MTRLSFARWTRRLTQGDEVWARMRDCVKQRAAACKCPHHVWLVDALPKGRQGKAAICA
jgi:acyl-coenzyme A synthetase/AMP-(fatty) acid ligase